MKISTKQKIVQYKESLKRLPYFLGEHSFIVFLALLCLTLFFGGILFYQYSFLAEKKEPRVSEAILQFERECFQGILIERQERADRFEKTQIKTYPDPFRKID